MIVDWLFLYLVVVLDGLYADESPKWVPMSAKEISSWYRPYDTCMLKQGLEKSPNMRECDGLFQSKFDWMCSATHKCQFAPKSLYTKPPSVNEEDSSGKPLLSFFRSLNESNRELVLVGDSITRQMLQAMACELLREHRGAITNPPVSKVLYDAVHYTVIVPATSGGAPRVRAHITLISIWKPFSIKRIFIPKANKEEGLDTTVLEDHTFAKSEAAAAAKLPKNTTTITSKGKAFAFSWMRGLVRSVGKQGRSGNALAGVVVLFNVGLHETEEEILYGYRKSMSLYLPKLNTVFRWAQSKEFLGNKNRKNVFIYRETSMQHFDGTTYGEYQADMRRKWDGNPVKNAPRCGPVNVSREDYVGHFWRATAEETALALADVRAGEEDHMRIRRLHFRELSRPIHDMKASSPSSSIRTDRKFFDCTHMCAPNAPLVWFPLYRELEAMLRGGAHA